MGPGHERHAPRAQFQQMVSDDVSGPAVVDADQVVRATLGIRPHVAVEEHDGNSRRVECAYDPVIDAIAVRGQFERREKDAGHAALDVLLAERPGARGLVDRAPPSPPPQISACSRASGDAIIP